MVCVGIHIKYKVSTKTILTILIVNKCNKVNHVKQFYCNNSKTWKVASSLIQMIWGNYFNLYVSIPCIDYTFHTFWIVNRPRLVCSCLHEYELYILKLCTNLIECDVYNWIDYDLTELSGFYRKLASLFSLGRPASSLLDAISFVFPRMACANT